MWKILPTSRSTNFCERIGTKNLALSVVSSWNNPFSNKGTEFSYGENNVNLGKNCGLETHTFTLMEINFKNK